MKVFDFTGGKKGELVGDVKRPTWMNGWTDANGDVLRLAKSPMALHTGGGYSDKAGKPVFLDPADFGCGAVCFSLGQLQDGTWEWFVIGTKEWLAHAEATGIVIRQKKPVPRLLPLREQIENLLGRKCGEQELLAAEALLMGQAA